MEYTPGRSKIEFNDFILGQVHILITYTYKNICNKFH
jgi:hypothetical protein